MIDEEDARAIVRHLGDVAMLDVSRTERRAALIDGLCRMVDADAWLWFTAAHTNAGKQPAHAVILKNGFTDEQFSLALEASDLPDMARLTAPFFEEFTAAGQHITRLRQQIDPENFFEKSKVCELWKRADIGPVMLSARPTTDGQVSMVGLYRRFGRPLFNEREARIVHIVLSEIPALHEAISPAELNDGVAGLPPRLRQTLNCMLQGYARKEIASQLSLSIHTVGEYIAELYKRFGVHSHAELVRRFLAGDGGDRPMGIG